jgi:hypothetical protein
MQKQLPRRSLCFDAECKPHGEVGAEETAQYPGLYSGFHKAQNERETLQQLQEMFQLWLLPGSSGVIQVQSAAKSTANAW